MRIHKAILIILYAAGFMFAIAVCLKGYGYYNLPLQRRPYSPLHAEMKPGGLWGHGLGILGSSMILLLFLYSARKRRLLGLRFGKIGQWLNIHIFFGVMGPVFINLHTSFKFGGIVAISYYAMMAVMLSGFIGRYLYVQIPRKLSGDELSIKEMEEKNRQMSQVLMEKYKLNPKFLQRIQGLSGISTGKRPGGISTVLLILENDLLRPFKIMAIKKQLRAYKGNLPGHEINQLLAVVKQKSLLQRKMAFLSTMKPMLHYWHVLHKPFAYVMVIIMFIHIAIAILFGYRWIF